SGYMEAALTRLEEAIAITPSLRTARWEIARAYALEARWDDYDKLIEKLLAHNVDRPLARSRYAWWRQDWVGMEKLREKMAQMGQALWPGLMADLFGIFLEGKWTENRDQVITAASAPGESHRRSAFVC